MLGQAQWQTLTAPLAHWLIINRKGQLQALPAQTQQGEVSKPTSHLVMDAKALDLVTQEAHIESLVQLLYEDMQPEFDAYQPATAYKNVRLVYSFAQKHAVQNTQDQAFLIVQALKTQGEILKNPTLLQVLANKAYEVGKLSQVVLL
jgi:hypothetical protein